MATAVDAIFVSLGLRTDQLEQGLKKVENRISQGVKRIAGYFLPLAGALSINAIASTFFQTAEAVDNLSRQLNINAETLQAWQGAAQQAGVGGGTFDGFLSKLADDVRGTGRTVEDELLRLNAQFSGLSDVQAERLGKKNGISTDVVTFLRMQRSELEEILETEYELGVLRNRDIERAKRLEKANDRLRKSFTALSGALIGAVTPALEWITTKATDFVNFLRKHETFTKAFFIGVAAAITGFMLPALASLAAAVWANPLTWIFAAIAAAVTIVALLIDDLIVSMRGGKSLFDWSPLVDSVKAIWQELQPLIDILGDLWDATKPVRDFFARALGPAIKAGIAFIVSFVKSFTDLIGSAIRFVNALISGDWAAIWETGKQLAIDAVMFLVRRITSAFEFFKTFLQGLGLWDPIVGTLSGVWDSITGTFESAINWVKDAIRKFIAWMPDWLKKKLFGGNVDFGLNQSSVVQGLSAEERARLQQEGYISAARATDAIAPSRISNNTNSNTNVRVDQTVNQTITTSDPVMAANRSTQGIRKETTEATKLAVQANRGVNQ